MSKYRVLILGNTGMLGHMVEHVLAADSCFDVRGASRRDFDVMQNDSPPFLKGESRCWFGIPASSAGLRTSGIEEVSVDRGDIWHPDYIINCIGITANRIDDADATSVASAIRVNSEFPHTLVALAAAHGAKVIHMSTDGVFAGDRDEAYSEKDIPDAQDTYGRTKILGESQAPNVLNIRTSIIGPSPHEGGGLWEWTTKQSDGATIQGYTNHIWHGVTTRQFAELCAKIITDEVDGARGKTPGVEESAGSPLVLRSTRESLFDVLRKQSYVLHFVPNDPISKYNLLCALRDALSKRITIEPIEHPTPIRRVLATNNTVLQSSPTHIPSLREALDEVISDEPI
ncbi:MAG: sugar nucleotide-binding protein [Candidatus Uhrbacteria bacterium]